MTDDIRPQQYKRLKGIQYTCGTFPSPDICLNRSHPPSLPLLLALHPEFDISRSSLRTLLVSLSTNLCVINLVPRLVCMYRSVWWGSAAAPSLCSAPALFHLALGWVGWWCVGGALPGRFTCTTAAALFGWVPRASRRRPANPRGQLRPSPVQW